MLKEAVSRCEGVSCPRRQRLSQEAFEPEHGSGGDHMSQPHLRVSKEAGGVPITVVPTSRVSHRLPALGVCGK